MLGHCGLRTGWMPGLSADARQVGRCDGRALLAGNMIDALEK